jgi:hypothetical protein
VRRPRQPCGPINCGLDASPALSPLSPGRAYRGPVLNGAADDGSCGAGDAGEYGGWSCVHPHVKDRPGRRCCVPPADSDRAGGLIPPPPSPAVRGAEPVRLPWPTTAGREDVRPSNTHDADVATATAPGKSTPLPRRQTRRIVLLEDDLAVRGTVGSERRRQAHGGAIAAACTSVEVSRHEGLGAFDEVSAFAAGSGPDQGRQARQPSDPQGKAVRGTWLAREWDQVQGLTGVKELSARKVALSW